MEQGIILAEQRVLAREQGISIKNNEISDVEDFRYIQWLVRVNDRHCAVQLVGRFVPDQTSGALILSEKTVDIDAAPCLMVSCRGRRFRFSKLRTRPVGRAYQLSCRCNSQFAVAH